MPRAYVLTQYGSPDALESKDVAIAKPSQTQIQNPGSCVRSPRRIFRFVGPTPKTGRANVWGMVVGAYTVAMDVKGSQLDRAADWLPEHFIGLALLMAVGSAKYERTAGRARGIACLIWRRPPRAVEAT